MRQWRTSTTGDGTEWHVSDFETGPLRWQFSIMHRPSTGSVKWSVFLMGDWKRIALKSQQQANSVDQAKDAAVFWLCHLLTQAAASASLTGQADYSMIQPPSAWKTDSDRAVD